MERIPEFENVSAASDGTVWRKPMTYEEQKAEVRKDADGKVASINTATDKKELAEKIAAMLGWRYVESNHWRIPDGTTNSYMDVWDLEELIFSWPTFGLCIEKAREWGWERTILGDGNVFFSKDIIEWTRTEAYQIAEYGDIEAIIRAFAEIPMEVENG